MTVLTSLETDSFAELKPSPNGLEADDFYRREVYEGPTFRILPPHREFLRDLAVIVTMEFALILKCRGGLRRGRTVESCFSCYARRMAKPDTPNFSPVARIIFGVIALVVIVTLLRYLGYL